MSIAIRIKDCIDNHEQYVAIMAALPDKELAKKLDLVHIQMKMAERNNNTDSMELLDVWHYQIIEARIYKAENNIPDAPNEIELAIADIETFVSKAEERQDILIKNTSVRTPKPRIKEDNQDQMSLF